MYTKREIVPLPFFPLTVVHVALGNTSVTSNVYASTSNAYKKNSTFSLSSMCMRGLIKTWQYNISISRFYGVCEYRSANLYIGINKITIIPFPFPLSPVHLCVRRGSGDAKSSDSTIIILCVQTIVEC